MILFISSLKLVAEIALMAILGRWLLGLLAGEKRSSNLFYQMLDHLVRPFTAGVRAVTPKLVVDRHIPLVTFILLSWVWMFALIEKVSLCRANPALALCQ